MSPPSQQPPALIDYEHESQPDVIRLAWTGSNVEVHLGTVRHHLLSGQNVERISARVLLRPQLAHSLHQQLGQLLGQLFAVTAPADAKPTEAEGG